MPLPLIIERLNHLYHEAEAPTYSTRHSEIFGQLDSRWTQMLDISLARNSRNELRVLDFGCGTGFATRQFLNHVATQHRVSLLCFDPSVAMLTLCKACVDPLGSSRGLNASVEFTSDIADLCDREGAFDVVLTNSVLHHLPDPLNQAKHFHTLLAPGGIWIQGHEPSRRYLLNPRCARAYRRFQLQRRLGAAVRRCFTGGRGSDAEGDFVSQVATKAVEEKLFAVQPSNNVVRELVDLHVPLNRAAAMSGVGFCPIELRERLADQFTLLYQCTYNFLGPANQGAQQGGWARLAASLQQAFPDDGANFSAVWRAL